MKAFSKEWRSTLIDFSIGMLIGLCIVVFCSHMAHSQDAPPPPVEKVAKSGNPTPMKISKEQLLQKQIDSLRDEVDAKDRIVDDLQNQLKASAVLRANYSDVPMIDISGLGNIPYSQSVGNNDLFVQWKLFTSPRCRPCHQRIAQIRRNNIFNKYKISDNVNDKPHILIVSISDEEWTQKGWMLPRFELFVNGESVAAFNGDAITDQQLIDNWNNAYNGNSTAKGNITGYNGNSPTLHDNIVGMKVGTLPFKASALSVLQSLQPFLDGGTLQITYTPKPGVVKDFLTINQGSASIRIPAKTQITFSMDKYVLAGKFSSPTPEIRIPIRGNTSVKSATMSPDKFAIQLSYMIDPEWYFTDEKSARATFDEPTPLPDTELAEMVQDSDFTDTFGEPRSGHWPTVRKAFVKLHPFCEACGSNVDLNVHHVKPFHVDPSLECDPTNLITLCREHHFSIGHNRNWKDCNPNVREDAVKEMQRLLDLRKKPTAYDWNKRANPLYQQNTFVLLAQ